MPTTSTPPPDQERSPIASKPARFAAGLAWVIVHRPKTLVALVIAVVLASVWVLKSNKRFDSEVLNLLPGHLEPVKALGELHNQFTQARELTFVLEGDPEVVAGFQEHFVEQLRAEPWALRVFTGPPFEVPEEMVVLQRLIPPLLLNLDETAFQSALQLIEPAAMETRLRDLREEIEGGSFGAEMKLNADPLGLLAAATRPLTSAYGKDDVVTRPTADSPVKVIPVMTNQESLSQGDCVALMEQVNRFQTRVATGWSGPVPKIGVTGRAAYVAQMSGSMERDIKLTSTISILAVSGLFFLGFRRIMPLVGLTLILAMSCLTAFALGCMFFNSLNMIAIAFGSILVGLGDDFSLLLYNRYLQARRKLEDHESAIATSIGEVGKGIFYVAITTGIGFLALLFSGSAGFAQLGLLIATGLCLCALFMVTLLFLFIRPQLADERPDPFRRLVDRYLRTIWKGPARISLPIWGLCIGAVLFAVLPIRPLHFDTNPRSLEPKSLPAAQALRSIIEGFPRVADPVVLIMKAANAEESHAQWSRLTTHLQQMVDAGELASVSSPLGLMLSPERQRRNLAALGTVDLDGKLKAFDELLEKEGFNPESFTEVRALFGRLKSMHAEGTPLSDLKSVIPPSSSWWFLIDRFFSAEPNVVAAYLTPSQPLATAAAQKRLEARIKECGVPVTATGWSYAMVSLVPWAKQELLVFGSGVCGLIIVLLALAYRAWRPWLLHVLSLLFALAATIATLKLANIRVNLLNAMAFPLILGVGVDYGLHLLLAIREKGDLHENLATVLKPVIICGLTTMTGFGSLIFAQNPALSGLGLVCALGVFWCLATSLLFLIPASRFLPSEQSNEDGAHRPDPAF